MTTLHLFMQLKNMELLKKKWNIQNLDRSLIARLLSELEGASYILDSLNQTDYDTIRVLCDKYYKLYFSLPKISNK